MKENELQQIKMAWLAADEAGDARARFALLRDHPALQDELIDFIAAYHVTSPAGAEPEILPLTRRATERALQRVFAPQTASEPVAAASLRDLRGLRGLALSEAARGLQLGVDVWKKFEDGLIEVSSLGERQLARLAAFFQISSAQFSTLLQQSHPAFTLNRRQTAAAARQAQHTRQTFAEALAKSTMSPAEKQSWLDA